MMNNIEHDCKSGKNQNVSASGYKGQYLNHMDWSCLLQPRVLPSSRGEISTAPTSACPPVAPWSLGNNKTGPTFPSALAKP